MANHQNFWLWRGRREGDNPEANPAIIIDLEADYVLHQIVTLNNIQPEPGAPPFTQPHIISNDVNQTVANPAGS